MRVRVKVAELVEAVLSGELRDRIEVTVVEVWERIGPRMPPRMRHNERSALTAIGKAFADLPGWQRIEHRAGSPRYTYWRHP